MTAGSHPYKSEKRKRVDCKRGVLALIRTKWDSKIGKPTPGSKTESSSGKIKERTNERGGKNFNGRDHRFGQARCRIAGGGNEKARAVEVKSKHQRARQEGKGGKGDGPPRMKKCQIYGGTKPDKDTVDAPEGGESPKT